jgi:hypothetical protein
VADECGFATSVIGTMTVRSTYAQLNGTDLLPNLLSQRQSCSSQPGNAPGFFERDIETGDLYELFGFPPGTYQAASDGYWLMLEPIPAEAAHHP